MSRRVTTKTEIKDKSIAINALKKAGYAYSERGSTLSITSGPLRGAMIDLTTGDISGDSDYSHTEDSLGKFRQNYSEAKYTSELQRQGITIESRNVNREGDIELVYVTA